VNVAPCGLLRSWSWIVFWSPQGSRLVGRWCPGCIAPQSCCWRLIIISKFVYDLQANKSPIVVKGPFFPRVVNLRYRIRGTNVWRKT
jgi:hypothetical protein